MEERRHRTDWLKWIEDMQVELNSLMRRVVFGHVVQTPKGVSLLGTNGYLYENAMKIMRS